MSAPPLHIAFAGLIGAGKTTLAQTLANHLKLPFHEEKIRGEEFEAQARNFYSNMAKHALEFEIFLLNSRYEQQQKIYWNQLGGVQDRSFYEDGIFVDMLAEQGHLSESQRKIYFDLFRHLSHNMTSPNFIVYLKVSPETALSRIHKRGIQSELDGITLEYLQSLERHYEQFIAKISRTCLVIEVDWNADTTSIDIESMATNIEKTYSSHTGIIQLEQ